MSKPMQKKPAWIKSCFVGYPHINPELELRDGDMELRDESTGTIFFVSKGADPDILWSDFAWWCEHDARSICGIEIIIPF